MDKVTGSHKILIVEDDPLLADALKDKLTLEGFSCVVAINGEDGLKKVTDEIDLIIMDILMPVMDGLTFYNKLHTTIGKDIPTIILSNLTETAYPSDIKVFLNKSKTSLAKLVEEVKAQLV